MFIMCDTELQLAKLYNIAIYKFSFCWVASNFTSLHHGCMKYCVQDTYYTVEETVDSMEIHGDNQDEKLCLQLVPPAEVPKLLRAEVYISGPHVESLDLFDCSKSKIS